MDDLIPNTYLKNVQDPDAVKERVRWAINYVSDNCGMTNESLAKVIGCATSTINSYRRKITMPKLEFFVVFLYQYSFSLDWFAFGQGEPFPGAFAKYPEICGPAGSVPGVHEPTPPYGALIAEQKINIEEAVGKAYKILSSGTALAAALYLNINQFAVALDTGRELKTCRDQISDLQVQINELRGQVDRLTAVPAGSAAPAAGSDKKVA